MLWRGEFPLPSANYSNTRRDVSFGNAQSQNALDLLLSKAPDFQLLHSLTQTRPSISQDGQRGCVSHFQSANSPETPRMALQVSVSTRGAFVMARNRLKLRHGQHVPQTE